MLMNDSRKSIKSLPPPTIKPLCLLNSKRLCMYNENTADHNTQQSQKRAEVFQTALGIVWFEGIHGTKCACCLFRAKATGKSCTTRLESIVRNISDFL